MGVGHDMPTLMYWIVWGKKLWWYELTLALTLALLKIWFEPDLGFQIDQQVHHKKNLGHDASSQMIYYGDKQFYLLPYGLFSYR